MTNVLLFVVLGFLIGGVIGYAFGKSQPHQNQGVGLNSFLRDAVAVAAAI